MQRVYPMATSQRTAQTHQCLGIVASSEVDVSEVFVRIIGARLLQVPFQQLDSLIEFTCNPLTRVIGP